MKPVVQISVDPEDIAQEFAAQMSLGEMHAFLIACDLAIADVDFTLSLIAALQESVSKDLED